LEVKLKSYFGFLSCIQLQNSKEEKNKEASQMKKLIVKLVLSLVVSLLVCMSLGSGIIASTDFAFAEEPAIVQGPTVTADPDSPTGYTVTFVYYNPNATQVRLAGDLTLLDVNTGNTRYQPEAWQTGRYHCGGTEFLRDMTKDADGYWSASIPMHAGGLSYWYRVWDPTQNWENKRIWDPTATHPRPAGNTTFRVINNDVLDAVYVPYDEKQNDPVLESRATYELPIASSEQRGTVQYIPYTTILGDSGYYLGVYLPPGYDENRAEPYKVMYFAHGIFGDETDGMIPGNMPNILDNMIARGEIEPTVLVTMGNHFTPDPRFPWPWYDRTNAANNLVQTILPFMEANFNVSNNREGRAFSGFSYGGSTGGIVIRDYPTTFGYYGFFSGNPRLTTENYNDIAASVGANALFVFLGRGYFEGNLNAVNTIRDNFRTREIFSETASVNGAHDMMTAGMLFTIFARDYLWTLPAQQITSLKESVAGMVTGGINQALTVKLDQALKLLSKDKPSEAIQVLNDFIGQVNDLSGVKLTEEQAAELITAAEQIISTIMASN
jgi:enterochelin esterase-like enzyme